MRFVKYIILACCLCLACLTNATANPDGEPDSVNVINNYDSDMLAQAYALRSSDFKESSNFHSQVRRASLSDAEKDVYDYLVAYLLFMNGKINESIYAFEALTDNAITAKGRFDAYSSLGSLYAATQNWSAGLRVIDYLTEHVHVINNIESEEQAHMALVNFYSLLGEIEKVKTYIERIPEKNYGSRFNCIVDMQYLASLIELKIGNLSDGDFATAVENCQEANEVLPVLYIHSQQATYYFELGRYDDALNLLLEYQLAIENSNYEPLLDDTHTLLGKIYFEKQQYEKAFFHANTVVSNVDGNNLVSDADVASFEVLYKIAESQDDYKLALSYYQKFAQASSKNLTQANSKELSIQKAKQDSIEKANRIALLDAENSLLRAQADLGEQTASHRLVIIGLFVFLFFLLVIWIYKRQVYYKVLQKTSQTDELTGISNRRHFVQQARQVLEYCKSNRRNASLILIDLDDFKAINDNFGHLEGDEAIKMATKVIKEECRVDDLFGRLGGEEFGILLSGCDINRAKDIAETCRGKLEKTNRAKGQLYVLTGSFGVVDNEIAGYDFEELFEAADKALYGAKGDGKNKVIEAA